jgi:nicotinamidase-related amidase
MKKSAHFKIRKNRIYFASMSICLVIVAAGGLFYYSPGKAVAPPTQDYSGLLAQKGLPRVTTGSVLQVKATSRSYFAKDKQGQLIPELIEGKQYYKLGEDIYNLTRSINTSKTALVVMDPWKDSGSPLLRNYNEPIIKKIVPLIKKSIDLEIPVIVLTNRSQKSADFGSQIHPDIEKLASSNKVILVYHQDTNSNKFAKWLGDRSIDTLIYCGFASNMCVIGRDLGMISMRLKGFRMFFVPEASAAVEFKESWETGAIHHSTTILISQWLAEIIALSDFLVLSKANSK